MADNDNRLKTIVTVLDALAPLIRDCQDNAPCFDVSAAANRYLAQAGIPCYYQWNWDEWRYDIICGTIDKQLDGEECPKCPQGN